MATQRDLNTQARAVGRPLTPWRDKLLPAHFDNVQFHVETGSMEGGRRIAMHEFPKKELPYAEDMGKRATEFSVRGYIIVYPHDDGGLYVRDYTIARDRLQARLDRGGPGTLQLPTYYKQVMTVVCSRYRMTEEDRLGGYCVFDMSFSERGVQPFKVQANTAESLSAQSEKLREEVRAIWALQRTDKSLAQIRRSNWRGRF